MKGLRTFRVALIVLFSIGVSFEARAYTSIFYENLLYNRVGRDTRAFVLADVDNDGDVDIASANFESHDVTVLLNEGDLSFRRDRSYRVGRAPHSIVGADLDGDGDVDLAVGNLYDDTISILLNDGNGVFGDKRTYECYEPTWMSGADLDGDGDTDLIVAPGTDRNLFLFFNDGDGSFPRRSEYVAEGSPHFVCPADVDGDGDTDLPVIELGTWSRICASILFNAGDGTFSETVLHCDGGRGLWVADFDGDGDMDLVKLGGKEVTFLSNEGAGKFSRRSAFYKEPVLASRVFGADFDNDGDVDIAALGTDINVPGHADIVTVLLNTGDGTFLEGGIYRVRDADWISGADLDLDGDVDLVTVGGDALSILVNNGEGTFALLKEERVRYPVGSGGQRMRLGARPSAIVGEDFDRDGDVDLITANRDDHTISILWNRGDGGFPKIEHRSAGFGPASLFAADLDADGDLEIAVGNRFRDDVLLLLNDGDGTFSSTRAGRIGTPGIMVSGGDLDGDHKVDLVAAGRSTLTLFLNRGRATFAGPVIYEMAGSPSSVRVSDLDGDDRPELIVGDEEGELSVLFNVGGDFSAPVTYEAGRGALSVCVADLDGDGDSDLATGGREDRAISVWVNRGDGMLRKAGEYPVRGSPVALAAADLDADGHSDLLSLSGDGSMTVLINQGEGTFAKEGDYFVGPEPTDLFAGDLDRDGDVDVAVSNGESDEVSILFNRTDRARGPVTLVEDSRGSFSTEPNGFRLDRNYPNPFNAETTIRYVLPESRHVWLVIYDVLGRKVRTLMDKEQTSGGYSALWAGKDDRGETVSTGVYFYRLEVEGEYRQVKRMMLLR